MVQRDTTGHGFDAAEPLFQSAIPALFPVAVFDYKAALDGVQGDEEFLKEISQMFLDLSPDLLGKVKQSVTSRDVAGIKRTAHAFKGAVSNLAARSVTAAVLSLEEVVHGENLAGTSDACERLEREIGRLQQALSQLLAAPPG